jgi:hypothetical protein
VCAGGGAAAASFVDALLAADEMAPRTKMPPNTRVPAKAHNGVPGLGGTGIAMARWQCWQWAVDDRPVGSVGMKKRWK